MKERNRDERAFKAARSRARKSEHSEIRFGRSKSSNKLMVSYQKRISIPGAPDFGPTIEELLEVAGITSTADARASLDTNLTIAWGGYGHDNGTRAPKVLFTQLEDSIIKTQRLLRRLGKFRDTHDIGFDICPVGDGSPAGDGTIAVTTFREMIEKPLGLPRNPPPLTATRGFSVPFEGVVAAIDVQRVLDRLLRELHLHKPKRKRGNQPEPDKVRIVFQAACFFRQYSTEEPTTYSHGQFVKFCKSFYTTVTSEPLSSSGLNKAIISVLNDPGLVTQRP